MIGSCPGSWGVRVRRLRSVTRDDRGSATAELALLTPLLITMMLFIVFCGRMAESQLRLHDAAHQAARAASIARNATDATTDAHETAQAALAEAGVTCHPAEVAVDGAGLRPGSVVTVDVACTVGLSDLSLLGVPGTTTLSASFSSPVDTYRSLSGIEGETP